MNFMVKNSYRAYIKQLPAVVRVRPQPVPLCFTVKIVTTVVV